MSRIPAAFLYATDRIILRHDFRRRREMKAIRKRILSSALSIILIVCMASPAYAVGRAGAGGGGGGGMGFFDGLDAFGNTTATIGCILNVGSVLANADWDDPGGVCLDLVDSIFGTSFGGDPMQETLDAIYSDVSEIKETTNQIKQSVDYLVENSKYVNRQLSMINGSLRTINSQLVRQTQMLSDIYSSVKQMNAEMTASFNNLTNLINEQTDTLKSVVYSSTAEIKMTNDLHESLQSYVNDYSKLYTYDNNILETLSANQDFYTAFYEAVMALDNGGEIMGVLNKITLQEGSVNNLTKREQDLIQNTNVTVAGRSYQVLKFHQDFIRTLMDFIAGTGEDQTHSVYTLNNNVGNIGDTVLAMGDYLTASNLNFGALTGNRGIGEMYYIYLTYSEQDSVTVHEKYKAFMDSMVAQYMTTAWLAEMSYGYRITAEANGNNNASRIRDYEQYLNNIHAQMIKVYAYYDYEYQKCINDYDYGGNGFGHDQEVVYYGNTGSDGVWSVVKKNRLNVPSGMSESSIRLALGEQFDLHYYYRYADVTERSDIVWTSSNPTVAAVDSKGEVLGLSRGVTTIKAEYMGTSAECLVSIGDCMAIANTDGLNRYHYHRYYSSGGEWVTDETPFFEEASDRGYDFYYGVTTYLADTVELSEDVRSAAVAETTGMTDANMDAFTWFVTGDGAVQLNDYQISAVSAGWSEIIGYKKIDSNHTYDFIGIPVHSTMETVFKDKAKDYSTYTKISSAQDLIALAQDPDGWGAENKYVLTADIDLGGMEWEPIGYAFALGAQTELSQYVGSTLGVDNRYSSYAVTVPFQGTFDGNGHTISNFKITKIPRTAEIEASYKEFFSADSGKTLYDNGRTLGLADLGLFGFAMNASITDLNVTDAVIDIRTNASTGIRLDGEEIPFDETFRVFAGSLLGASYWDPVMTYYEYLKDKYQLQGDDPPTEAMLDEMYLEIEAPARFKEYYETYKADTENENSPESRYSSILMAYGVWNYAMKAEDPGLSGCYATGNIRVNNSMEKGAVFAGTVAGGSSSDFTQCTSIGDIEVTASEGACGGMLGIQYAKSGVSLLDCTVDADISATGGAAAGGLIGEVEGRFCFDLNDIAFEETDTAEENEKNAELLSIYMLFAAFLGGSLEKLHLDTPNTVIKGNEIIGLVNGSGNTGGLIGYRTGYGDEHDLMAIMQYNVEDDQVSYHNYNTDILCNYVACDVTSTAGASGGLIGLSDIVLQEGSESTPVVISRGKISKNYFTGKVDGGSGSAAGLVGFVNHDYSDLTQNISAATQIKGSGYKAYAINGRENGAPLVNGSGNTWNVAGALVYNGIGSGIGDDGTTKGDVAVFNDPQTYLKILGEDNFLDLSGGLKEDGTNGLDLAAGLIPKKLVNRYRFPVETVPQFYHQGETFLPVTSVYKYTGTGTELITSGVTSTTPDMSKIGIQTVTLTYADFTDTYDVVIYPSAGCLKITKMPAVEKNGSGISGGQITLYENGSISGTAVNLNQCTVTRNDDDIFIIKYGKYTTALRPIYIDVYTNQIGSAQAEYVGSEFYAPGASANVFELMPADRTVGGTVYHFAGASQEGTFTVSEDLCVLSFYSTDAPAAAKVVKGKIYKVSGQTYKVTKVATAKAQGTVTLIKAKNAKSVTVPATVKLADGKAYKVTQVNAKAFTGAKIRTVTVGKNVTKLAKNAFAKSKATKVVLKTKLLKKAGVKGCLKSSKVKTVQVKVGSKTVNKKTVKAYKKIFTKKIAGKKVTVK